MLQGRIEVFRWRPTQASLAAQYDGKAIQCRCQQDLHHGLLVRSAFVDGKEGVRRGRTVGIALEGLFWSLEEVFFVERLGFEWLGDARGDVVDVFLSRGKGKKSIRDTGKVRRFAIAYVSSDLPNRSTGPSLACRTAAFAHAAHQILELRDQDAFRLGFNYSKCRVVPCQRSRVFLVL